MRTHEYTNRFASLRDSYKVLLTDHELRAVYQSNSNKEVLCVPSSDTGRALIRELMAERKGDKVCLTASGVALHYHLREFETVYFGPDTLMNIFWIWWCRPSLSREVAVKSVPAFTFEPMWTAADEAHQTRLWLQGIDAFWLCPDGIEAGMLVHDEFLATGKLPAALIEQKIKKEKIKKEKIKKEKIKKEKIKNENKIKNAKLNNEAYKSYSGKHDYSDWLRFSPSTEELL